MQGLWTPGSGPAAFPAVVGRKVLREARRQEAREQERWQRVRDPDIDRLIRRLPTRPRVKGVYRMVPAYKSSNSSTQGSSPRTTGAVTTAVDDLAFVVMGCEDAGTIGSTGISGSVEGSSDWTVDTLIDGSGPRLQAGWKILTTSGSQTFAVTATGAAFMEAVVVLVTGIDTVTPYDKRTTNTGSSATITTGVSANYAVADSWLVFASKLYNNADYGTYLNSFVERFDGVGLAVAERTVSSTTGLGAGCTSTVNDAWAAGQWAFRGASTGNTGALAATFNAITAALDGEVAIAGDLSPTIAAVAAALAGEVGISGDLAATYAAMAAQIQEDTAITGDLAATLPALLAALDGVVDITGDLAAQIPALLAVLRDAQAGSMAHAVRRRLLLLLAEEDD